MQQDKKFIWPAAQMCDIRYYAMCAPHGCPFTTTDQALTATILDATAVKVSAWKCFHCGGFDHLVDGCPFPQTASLETAETLKKGAWVRQMPKPAQAKSSSLTQVDKWFHDGGEGCNNGPMSAATVNRSTLIPNVVSVAQSPLHLNNFCKYLANHPDQAWCSKLLKGIEQGVDISFEGKRTSIISNNWKSTLEHPEVIAEYLANEVAAGHKAGLFTQPPFLDFVGSPMGIVTKKCSFPVKYRIIHNLSWPSQDCVNDHINPDAFRCFYSSFDDAVALVIKCRVGTLSAKLDLADTFKHILIRSQDWPLLGSSWDLQWPAGSMTHLYYIDLFLLFGLCSSQVLFNEYADALLYTMKASKVQDLLHYLDDYFTVGPPHSLVCANNISAMITTCEELGFAVNPEKVTKLATTTNFLGINIDSVPMEAWIDPTHLSKTISLLKDIMGHWSTTKQSILSLIDKVHFVCCVCRPVEPFSIVWLKHPQRLNTSITELSWTRSPIGTLIGGCSICPHWMGSAFYMNCTGSPA